MCLNWDSQPKSPTPNLTRCFSSINISKFNSLLENIDISLISNATLPNSAFELLMESYTQVFNQSFPLKAFPPNNLKFNKPWYDDELHQLMLNKNKLFKKFICKKSPTLIRLEICISTPYQQRRAIIMPCNLKKINLI